MNCGAAEHVRPVALSAFVLVLAAGLLYATELSRATAAAILPFAVCLSAVTRYAYRSGRWPGPAWMVSLMALAALALGCAAWLYAYGLTHPPVAT